MKECLVANVVDAYILIGQIIAIKPLYSNRRQGYFLEYSTDIYNELSFNFTAQSGRPYTIANTVFEISNIGVPIYLQRNNSRLPYYQRLDFSWKVSYSRDPKNRFKKDWIFTVYNVLGRKNPFNIYYTERDGTSNDGIIFGSIFASTLWECKQRRSDDGAPRRTS